MGQTCSSCFQSLISGRRYRLGSSSSHRPAPIVKKLDPYALNVRSVDHLNIPWFAN